MVQGSPLLAKQSVASMGRSQTHPPGQTHSIDQRPSLGYRLVVWRRVGLATPVHWVRPAILGLYRRFVINTSKWSCSNYLADHILLSWTRVPAECPQGSQRRPPGARLDEKGARLDETGARCPPGARHRSIGAAGAHRYGREEGRRNPCLRNDIWPQLRQTVWPHMRQISF